jgi:hypothetical protein
VKRRVPGIDERRHQVELDVRPDSTPGFVHVAVLRSRRSESKSDRALVLTPSGARALMRALQSAADEASRRAYVAEKATPTDLEADVAAVVRALSRAESDAGASAPHPPGET